MYMTSNWYIPVSSTLCDGQFISCEEGTLNSITRDRIFSYVVWLESSLNLTVGMF